MNSQLLTFKTVADLCSFSLAGRVLHLTQPTISLHIRALEETYGLRLLERDAHSVHLTIAGKVLYQYAEQILALHQQAQEAMQELQGTVSGTLLLAASMTIGEYVLPQVLGHFTSRYPRVKVQLEVGNTSQVMSLLLNKQVELGLAEGQVNNPNLEVEPFMDDELILIVHPDHPWTRCGVLQPQKLLEENLVCREPGSGTRRVAEEVLASAGIEVARLKVTLELGSTQAVKRAVQEGLGVAIISRWSVEQELRLGLLAQIHLEGASFPRQFSIVRRRNGELSRVAKAYYQFLRSTTLPELFTNIASCS